MSEDLLKRWWKRLQDLKNLHFQASNKLRTYHHRSGIPLVIFAALANAGLWAVLLDLIPSWELIFKLVLAVLGTIITVLSAIQAFLGFEKRSELHKYAATKYSSLSGEIDLLLNRSEGFKTDDLTRITDKWNLITENAPLLPKNISKDDPSINIQTPTNIYEKDSTETDR